jgi:hypothetical protein
MMGGAAPVLKRMTDILIKKRAERILNLSGSKANAPCSHGNNLPRMQKAIYSWGESVMVLTCGSDAVMILSIT